MPVKVSLSVTDVCVSESLTPDLLLKLDGLYASYHKQWWCRRQLFYHFKTWNTVFNALALTVMALSIVVGAVWEQSYAVVGLTAFATFIKGWCDFKKYYLKMDMSRFAYTTYEIRDQKLCTRWIRHVRFQQLSSKDADFRRNHYRFCTSSKR